MAFIVFPIIYFLFMFFCCAYSGIMMSQITEAIDCQNCSGMERKYLIMANFCFGSSITMLFMSICATPWIYCEIRRKKEALTDCCCYKWHAIIFFIAAVCVFFANFILIPSTIFIQYKDETTVLSAAYKGFLIIWIIMLALPIVLIAMFSILMCLRRNV